MNRDEKILVICNLLGRIIGTIAGWFLVSALVYWGYLGLSYLISLPTITYWAVFAIVVMTKILNIQVNSSIIKRG